MACKIECSKCPFIAGDSWCKLKKAETWKTNIMCKAGLFQRICDATLKLNDVYNNNPEDKRIEGGEKQIEEMSIAYHKLKEDNTEKLLDIYKKEALKPFEELSKEETFVMEEEENGLPDWAK
jgi:hypothetical protein